MKKIAVVTLSLASIVSACGGSGVQVQHVQDAWKPSQAVNGETAGTGSIEPAPVPGPENSAPASRSYSGLNLTLTDPSPSRLGVIKLLGKDAEVLFSALTVKVLDKGSTKVRQGYDVSCRHVLAKDETTCFFKIDYENGRVSTQESVIHSEGLARERNYDGYNLELRAGSNPSYSGTVGIGGEDARALYIVMRAKAVPSPAGDRLDKQGEDIVCSASALPDASGAKEYGCSFTINYRTGEAL